MFNGFRNLWMDQKRAVGSLSASIGCKTHAVLTLEDNLLLWLDIFGLILVRLKLKRTFTVAQVNVGSLALISPLTMIVIYSLI